MRQLQGMHTSVHTSICTPKSAMGLSKNNANSGFTTGPSLARGMGIGPDREAPPGRGCCVGGRAGGCGWRSRRRPRPGTPRSAPPGTAGPRLRRAHARVGRLCLGLEPSTELPGHLESSQDSPPADAQRLVNIKPLILAGRAARYGAASNLGCTSSAGPPLVNMPVPVPSAVCSSMQSDTQQKSNSQHAGMHPEAASLRHDDRHAYPGRPAA